MALLLNLPFKTTASYCCVLIDLNMNWMSYFYALSLQRELSDFYYCFICILDLGIQSNVFISSNPARKAQLGIHYHVLLGFGAHQGNDRDSQSLFL